MKIFLAFVYFFGCILVIFGLLWLLIWVAPSEYVLDRSTIARQGGKLQHPERLFPNLTSRDSYGFPGASAGLVAWGDKVKGWVLVCETKKQAGSVFKAYSSYAAKDSGYQSSGPGYLTYRSADRELRGQVKLIDEVIVHVQGRDDDTIEKTFQQAGLIVPNPKANILTDIAHTNKYIVHLAIFIVVYAAIQLPIWNRVASWAASIKPKRGIVPISEPELRQRLLAINGMDVPFHVVEKKRNKLDIVWRLADAKWVGLMTANRVSRVEILRLRLSDHNKSCRAVEISKAIKASADGSSLQFAFSFSFFRGIVFGQWEYEKQFGLIFRDGGLTFGTAYEYKFSLSELKNPVVNIIVSSGWSFKPVMFFSKILGG
ncbi:MAG: hypothetical protein ABSB22_22620 [Thermodesulfobacteriota bacterium]|jgi:hypothetical protein